VELELEWIHGYRSDDTRNSVRYNADGDIVYTAAGVGIAYNQETHQQRCVWGLRLHCCPHCTLPRAGFLSGCATLHGLCPPLSPPR
jgi:hypothetical protein